MCLLALARFYVSSLYNEALNHGKNTLLAGLYFALTTSIGVTWGFLAFIPDIFSSVYSFIAVFLIMGAVVFISIIILSMNRIVQILYLSPLPLAIVFNLLVSHRQWSVQGASFALMYWLFMLWLGKQQCDLLTRSLVLQFTNEELIEKLKLAVDREALANRAKSNFLAHMSHEIRTPINGIIGMTNLALDTELTSEQQDILNNVFFSAESLLGLLNDILDSSKIEAGQLTIEDQDFCLKGLLEKLVSSMHYMAREKNITLEDHTDYSVVPSYIRADELRIRQILTNLIGNGIKFTRTGGVTVMVKSEKLDSGKIKLHFFVKDTGPGIPADKQEMIFESFSQAESSTTREFGGTGLGLTISRKLANLMGGSIRLESEEGRGSIFHLEVPVMKGTQPKSRTRTAIDSSMRKNMNVLLVEDNRVNQEVARMILEREGHSVCIAQNGFDALQRINDDDFDVVLMDVQMPEMDGITATTIIRQCEAGQCEGCAEFVDTAFARRLTERITGRHISVIAMTANAMDEDRKKCLAAGMDHYLTKPFMAEHLVQALHEL